MKRIEKNLADHLIAEGIVKAPGTRGTAPVVFINPTAGAPSPTDLKNQAAADISLTIETSGGTGTAPYEGFIDRLTYTLTFRCKPQKEKEVVDLAYAIDAELDDKRAWTMGDIRVEISQRYLPLQKFPTAQPEQGSTFQSEYYFLVRKSELAD